MPVNWIIQPQSGNLTSVHYATNTKWTYDYYFTEAGTYQEVSQKKKKFKPGVDCIF